MLTSWWCGISDAMIGVVSKQKLTRRQRVFRDYSPFPDVQLSGRVVDPIIHLVPQVDLQIGGRSPIH